MTWKAVGLGGHDQENPNSPINVSLTPLLFDPYSMFNTKSNIARKKIKKKKKEKAKTKVKIQ